MTPRRKRTHRRANLTARLHSKAQTEAQAKNEAYYFIVLNGLFADFTAFHYAYKGKDAHRDCVRTLAGLHGNGNPVSDAEVERARIAWEAWQKEHFGKQAM